MFLKVGTAATVVPNVLVATGISAGAEDAATVSNAREQRGKGELRVVKGRKLSEKSKFFALKFGQFAKTCYFCTRNGVNGALTEWLGNGLQNRLQQFESARHLYQKQDKRNRNKSAVALKCFLKRKDDRE